MQTILILPSAATHFQLDLFLLLIFCHIVTENPGIKPRNTNVVLKGRHSLLQCWLHGGYFHRTCIPHTFSMWFI